MLPGPTARGPFLAHDDLRERSGWMLNAKRRTRAELDARPPPAVDTRTALWSEADELWQPDEGYLSSWVQNHRSWLDGQADELLFVLSCVGKDGILRRDV